jgi:mRNA-degrading endonuclease RelE of RelBE toxin-antitoxin system
MALIIPRSVRKQLDAMPKADATRLLNRLEQIAAAPDKPHPNIAQLVGQPEFFRVRQGDWRAVFSFTEGETMVASVGHRREIYR